LQLNTRKGWSERFEEFWADFSKCFKREETGQAGEKYVRGLLAEVERKNCWQLAEIMKENNPDTLQRLLYQAQCTADLVCKILRAKAVARLGYAPEVEVIDESAFVKRGDKSAGVGRQYCGHLGKIENCQVGVFLGYIAPLGYAFLDRELYIADIGECEFICFGLREYAFSVSSRSRERQSSRQCAIFQTVSLTKVRKTPIIRL